MLTKPLSELTKDFSVQRKAHIAQQAEALRTGVMINKLRTAKGLTQSELAERLGMTQQQVSRMEWGEDVRVGTLAKVIAALGGELVVHLPEGNYPIFSSEFTSTDTRPTEN